jgi:hypothetical protein
MKLFLIQKRNTNKIILIYYKNFKITLIFKVIYSLIFINIKNYLDLLDE